MNCEVCKQSVRKSMDITQIRPLTDINSGSPQASQGEIFGDDGWLQEILYYYCQHRLNESRPR